ncbi:MAG: hypothetical protein ACTH2Q_01385 [Propionibacteriaceae bacterium]
MPTLIDFLPAEAAFWLEEWIHRGTDILIDGPAASGRTSLLAAFAHVVADHGRIAGLGESAKPLACLAEVSHKLELRMPAVREHEPHGGLAHLLNRQMARIAVVDEPSSETEAMLRDVHLSGIRVWAAGARDLGFYVDVRIRLGLDPRHRVELVTFKDEPVYRISDGQPKFSLSSLE